MKKNVSVILFIVFLYSSAYSATLLSAVSKETPDKLRLVITMDKAAPYKMNKGNTYVTMIIPNLKVRQGTLKNFPSRILESLKIEEKSGTCEIRASFKYLTSSKVSVLKKPNRVIIDFIKLSKMSLPKIQSPEIEKIYTKSLPDKFKIAIYLTSFVPYKIISAESGLILELPDTNSIIKSRKIITKDKLIPKVAIDQVGRSSIISIAQNYPAFYQIYKLENPNRLVIEYDKSLGSTLALKDISGGIRYIKLVKSVEEGPSTVNALVVDQTSYEVFPCLASKKPEAPNFLGVMGSIFTFWMPKEEEKYERDKVSNMASNNGAIAAVNGTFFGKVGEPLGILMINNELISYSIHDRTALIIDKNNRCYIDNVSLSGEVSLEGVSAQVSGINNKRQTGEVIVYTSKYGNQTNEDTPGTVLSVIGNEVKNVSRARAWIPQDGYAISFDPSYYETIGNKAKVGSRVNLSLKLMPLSSIPNLEIKHVIGGGPRLLKGGQVYISDNSERFKGDIAKSRAARTAVGISKDGLLVFATVDKNKQGTSASRSYGASLEELAQIMKDLGCVDAMNLDGGSSSTMVLSGEVVNAPSSGNEIAVSNCILIRK